MFGLHDAASEGNLIQIDRLLDQGVCTNERDDEGRTALHLAANTDVATALLDRGADIEAKGLQYGNTALHLAAEAGNADIVALFLSRGADSNARNGSGLVPLDLAKNEQTHQVFLPHRAAEN